MNLNKFNNAYENILYINKKIKLAKLNKRTTRNITNIENKKIKLNKRNTINTDKSNEKSIKNKYNNKNQNYKSKQSKSNTLNFKSSTKIMLVNDNKNIINDKKTRNKNKFDKSISENFINIYSNLSSNYKDPKYVDLLVKKKLNSIFNESILQEDNLSKLISLSKTNNLNKSYILPRRSIINDIDRCGNISIPNTINNTISNYECSDNFINKNKLPLSTKYWIPFYPCLEKDDVKIIRQLKDIVISFNQNKDIYNYLDKDNSNVESLNRLKIYLKLLYMKLNNQSNNKNIHKINSKSKFSKTNRNIESLGYEKKVDNRIFVNKLYKLFFQGKSLLNEINYKRKISNNLKTISSPLKSSNIYNAYDSKLSSNYKNNNTIDINLSKTTKFSYKQDKINNNVNYNIKLFKSTSLNNNNNNILKYRTNLNKPKLKLNKSNFTLKNKKCITSKYNYFNNKAIKNKEFKLFAPKNLSTTNISNNEYKCSNKKNLKLSIKNYSNLISKKCSFVNNDNNLNVSNILKNNILNEDSKINCNTLSSLKITPTFKNLISKNLKYNSINKCNCDEDYYYPLINYNKLNSETNNKDNNNNLNFNNSSKLRNTYYNIDKELSFNTNRIANYCSTKIGNQQNSKYLIFKNKQLSPRTNNVYNNEAISNKSIINSVQNTSRTVNNISFKDINRNYSKLKPINITQNSNFTSNNYLQNTDNIQEEKAVNIQHISTNKDVNVDTKLNSDVILKTLNSYNKRIAKFSNKSILNKISNKFRNLDNYSVEDKSKETNIKTIDLNNNNLDTYNNNIPTNNLNKEIVNNVKPKYKINLIKKFNELNNDNKVVISNDTTKVQLNNVNYNNNLNVNNLSNDFKINANIINTYSLNNKQSYINIKKNKNTYIKYKLNKYLKKNNKVKLMIEEDYKLQKEINLLKKSKLSSLNNYNNKIFNLMQNRLDFKYSVQLKNQLDLIYKVSNKEKINYSLSKKLFL